MIRLLAHWFDAIFAPVAELQRNVPPRAMIRLFAPL
jgi:hypothetical protein